MASSANPRDSNYFDVMRNTSHALTDAQAAEWHGGKCWEGIEEHKPSRLAKEATKPQPKGKTPEKQNAPGV